MTTVTRLPETPNQRIARQLRDKKVVGERLRYAALGAALDYVLEHHPEAQTPQAQYDLAIELAKASLLDAANGLMQEEPDVAREVTLE